MFSRISFIPNHFNWNRNRNTFVSIIFEFETIDNICYQIVTKPVLLKKTKKNQSVWLLSRSQLWFKIVTFFDRHKCHTLSVTGTKHVSVSVWNPCALSARLTWKLQSSSGHGGNKACVFSIFNVGGCMCVYTPIHTHTAQMARGYSVVRPGVGTRHLEGPKNPNGTKSQHTYIRICVQSVYVRRRDEILDWLLFPVNYFFFRNKKAKDVNANHR